MPTTTIFFADNDPDFLDTRAEFLEKAGYQVLKAYTLKEARQFLADPCAHLAILDIRMVNDDDEWDTSGLSLAEQMPRFIPKIILTGFPTHEAVRRMLSTRQSGIPAAVDFVAKAEGPERLLVSISRTISMLAMVRRGEMDEAVPRPGENRDVFVVHGHDEAAKHEVARFIENLGLNAIILGEQASGGRTLIEQLERYSDVSFAIVLLTPDDVGYPKGKKPRKLTCRARQNVIFELGFFIGCLTRARVRSLYKDDVELLSDYHGVVYIPMDSAGGWKARLAKELEEAGFLIDPQKLKDAL